MRCFDFWRHLAAIVLYLLSVNLSVLAKEQPVTTSADEQQVDTEKALHTGLKQLQLSERAKREALQITDILQHNGKIYIIWHDPYPGEPRNYYLQSELITTLSSVIRKRIRRLNTSFGGSTSNMVEQRVRLDKELAQAQKNDRVISEWRPIKDVSIETDEQGRKVASFNIPDDIPRLTVRITSVFSDGSSSPFRSVMRIPIEPNDNFWSKYGWLTVGLILLSGFSSFLVWSFRRRGFRFGIQALIKK